MVGQIIYLPGRLIYLPGHLIYVPGHLIYLSNPGRGCVARQSEQECVFLGRETSHTGFFQQNLYIRLNLMFNNLRRARYRSDRLAQSQTDRSDRLPPLRSQFLVSYYHLTCICGLCRVTLLFPSNSTPAFCDLPLFITQTSLQLVRGFPSKYESRELIWRRLRRRNGQQGEEGDEDTGEGREREPREGERSRHRFVTRCLLMWQDLKQFVFLSESSSPPCPGRWTSSQ